MARVPQRGTHQPTREGQDLQREGQGLARAVEALERRVEALEGRQVPVGACVLIADGDSHEGWLLAHGATVGRRQYAELFGVLGETFGAGDGQTTFDLPDLSAAEPAGFDYFIRSGVYA
jgi:class 3 adenylate cyclase